MRARMKRTNGKVCLRPFDFAQGVLSKIEGRRGVTLMELVIAMAMITIIFAAVLPQFALIRNSWDIKQGTAEALQNGRVLMDHINRNLSKAKQITAVAASSINFNDCNGVTFQYDVNSVNNYVEYGLTSDRADLAGPVNSLTFTCYDACDLDDPNTDVSKIRTVRVESTVTNTGLGQDKTFAAWAYLRTNGSSQTALTKGTTFEFDTSNGQYPALSQIDSTHYLCAYMGPGSDGFANVLTVNLGTWTISKSMLTALEFDTSDGQYPALSQIDSTHYLCAYRGPDNDGFAIVLTVNPGTWAVSKATLLPLEYDTSNGLYPVLSQIDSTHYLCAYTGTGNNGFAIVLTVDPGTWAVTKATLLPLEYDASNSLYPALSQIDSTHYLCAYTGSGSDGFAIVLTVDLGTWAVTKATLTALEFDTADGTYPALAQIDSTHYLCAYTGTGNDGFAIVLTVNPGTWAVSKATLLPFEYDTSNGLYPALSQIHSSGFLCSYQGPSSRAWAVVLNVDSAGWTISAETPLEFDSALAWPALAQIDAGNYLCVYAGQGSDGWAALFCTLRP